MVDVAYLPIPCMHCDDAPCLTEDGAVYKREDGIVLIDSDKAKGRKDLLDLCPYGTVWWNDEAQVAQKCTFCARLLDDGWAEPRCVQACPTGAMRFVLIDQADMGHCVREFIERLSDSYRTVIFLHDLHGMTNPEIAQALDCSLATVKIRLHRARTRLKEALAKGCDFSYDERGVFVCRRKRPTE